MEVAEQVLTRNVISKVIGERKGMVDRVPCQRIVRTLRKGRVLTTKYDNE